MIDYSGFAFPKNVRVKDKKAIAKKSHVCQFCGKAGVTHSHHIKTKGSGGDDKEENLIELCPICHDLVHRGKIKREQILRLKKG